MAADIKRDPALRRASIGELETAYDGAAGDFVRLKALARELAHRKTDRAGRLDARVRAALSGIPVPQADLDFGTPDETSAAATPTIRMTDPDPAGTAGIEDSADGKAGAAGSAAPSTVRPDAPPPLVNLDGIANVALPDVPDHPAAILAAWTAIEALDANTYRHPHDLAGSDRTRIVKLKGDAVPWPDGKSIPKHQLFYQIPLGVIRMAEATKALVGAFGADEELNPRQTERAVMAAILVDRNGVPLEEDSVAISSLAWALPQVLAGNITSLGGWSAVEQQVVDALSDIVRVQTEEGDFLPLTRARLDLAHDWLVRQFRLDTDMIDPVSFTIRRLHYYKATEPPKVDLLNSFFLQDLERAGAKVSAGTAPPGLARYLGHDRPTDTADLLTDRTALEAAVAPGRTPPIRWPSAGGHPLVLLQQAAVNLAREELEGADGIVSVNGPPGTGKTTLLRDIVAGCILDRARAMAAFDDPVKAFSTSGQRMKMGQGFFHLYELDPTMIGHEIIVASSNNKAVENVSAELPAIGAIGRETSELNYLRTLSDRVHAPAVPFADRGRQVDAPEEKTWGMIAAVLGNAGNRSEFMQAFWWDQDRGFQTYLKAAQGKPVVREVRDDQGTLVRRETPAIVANEQPPGPDEARGNWIRARKRFRAALDKAETALAALERDRGMVRALDLQRIVLAEHHACRFAAEETVRHHMLATDRTRLVCSAAEQRLSSTNTALQDHDAMRPGLSARLFRTASFGTWRDARASLLKENAAAETAHGKAGRSDLAARKAHEAAAHELAAIVETTRGTEIRIAKLEASLEPLRERLGSRLVDDAFFAQGHEGSNLSAPWIPDDVHRAREEVFIAAIALHKAFIDATAQKMQHNLGVLMTALKDGTLGKDERRKLLPHLWSTLFCVVPVISTTFASVGRMLGDLPEGSIGWLLVDEAGQAVPQAAVGAVLRARRTIVVGDPLQVPPVITLPARLVEAIADEFRIDDLRWMPPEASVQTVADRASRHQGEFRGDIEPRRVGIPLLVHRRCLDPMFGISNTIAYDGQMVHAVQTPPAGEESPVTRALGRSRWIDIDGEAETKWCPDEGEMALRLLRKLASDGIHDPGIFIVTPFRDVANGMRSRLRDETDLFAGLNVEAADWIGNRIGTVHTVQGREADAVILIMGAPSNRHGGARAWAATSPNILNVAVSRAKRSLYVIGSHGAWADVGHARTMANALPIAGRRQDGGAVHS